MTKPEQVTSAQLNKKAVPHCNNCGASEIRAGALASWDTQGERWCIVEVNEDESVCCRCGRDVSIKWRLSPGE